MTKETFAKASKVVDKPSNVKIHIRLCTNLSTGQPEPAHLLLQYRAGSISARFDQLIHTAVYSDPYRTVPGLGE